jgi:predicted nucleotidyltransferase
MENGSIVSNSLSQKQKNFYIESIEDKLDIIKEAIFKYVPVKKIYLFGSYAYGNPNENSDIDIYVVVCDEFNKSINDALGEIANHVFIYNILNVDLFLVKEYKFKDYLTYSSFEKTIYNKGVLLYGN